jgi:broad specificity phosphatase PhoE
MVISSPRRRALATAEFASLSVEEVSPLIAEWDYGRYEGLTTAQTRELQPDCLVWTHGARAAKASLRSPIVLTEPSRWRYTTWRHATCYFRVTATFPAR